MQILYDYQKAETTREAHGQKVPLPSIQIYSDLPREWPMARLAVSNKQINRLVRTFLWRRVTEQALCRWLTPRSDSNSRAISRHLETTWATVRKPPIQVTKPAVLTPPWKRKVPQLQQGLQ